jgi:hypothetical protein
MAQQKVLEWADVVCELVLGDDEARLQHTDAVCLVWVPQSLSDYSTADYYWCTQYCNLNLLRRMRDAGKRRMIVNSWDKWW